MSSVKILNSQATLDLTLTGVKLVEASAGTGKTYAIGNLYLRMLLNGFSVSEILLVTFTKAATEELRGRIRQRIYDALIALEDIEKPRKEHKDEFLRLWTASLPDLDAADLAKRQLKVALTSMDEAAIYTIHGFCQRSLTEHAFNSRQAFDIDMITDDSQIWQDAMKDWWRINTYNLNEEGLLKFTNAVGNLESFIKLQEPLRKPCVKLVPEAENDIHEKFSNMEEQWSSLAQIWDQRHEDIIEILSVSKALGRGEKTYRKDKLDKMCCEWNAYFNSDEWFNIPARFTKLGATALYEGCTKKKRGTDPALDDPFFVECQLFIDEFERVKGAFRIRALADAHAYSCEKVTSSKQKSGQLAFDDQLVLLEEALTNSDDLVCAIRKHFPVAMIDEFQDTDAVQYGIFQHIYQADSATGLIMIGDPKQAIYSFRGGDIFAYIKAKKDADEHYTLDTNWRSTPGLIKAVNHLFSNRDDPFIYADIPFETVKACGKDPGLLCHLGRELTPLTLWKIPADDDGKVMHKTALTPLMHAYTANEIVRLLTESRKGKLKLAGKPVKPGDIAVLVRGYAEATGLREALQERGISAVASGRQHVFESDEAKGLKLLLAAVIGYRDADMLRQGMASALLGLSYTEIHDAINSDQLWLNWTVHFAELHQTWIRRGFIPMFQQMLRTLNIGASLARGHQSERRLTNLLHLGELLQQATQSITGMEALLVWFEHQLTDATSGEDTELRLENDADLVSIVTIHSSKGLEYPIVFLPYMWSCRPNSFSTDLLPFYDEEQGHRCLDAGMNEEHLLLSEKERLAEDVRLAYVALTRACTKVYLGWGDASFKVYGGAVYNSASTALGWLLHPGQQVKDLISEKPRAFTSGSNTVQNDLKALCDASGQSIELVSLSPEMPETSVLSVEQGHKNEIKAKAFSGDISEDWRISSFSSLTRDIHQNFSPVIRTDSSDDIFNFPAGSQTGLFMHALLEKMDFQTHDVGTYVQAFTSRNALRYGLDPEKSPILAEWVKQMLNTAINETGLKLVDLSVAQRLNELEFDFSSSRLDIGLLNQTLDKVADKSLQHLQINHSYSGYITGIIDLIFEHDGRYYLADYKSNHLGFSLDAYAPEQLSQTVFDRRYDLQYLIYSLALHRYLKLRLPNYEYECHFGGSYYLFLRGMRSSHGNQYGVYYDKPKQQLIEYLDEQVFSAEVSL